MNNEKIEKFGFTVVVVVTFFAEILYDFHDFCFGICLFPEENQQPVLVGLLVSIMEQVRGTLPWR